MDNSVPQTTLPVIPDQIGNPSQSSNSAAKRDLDLLVSHLNAVELPPELKEKATGMIERLERMFTQGFYSKK